MPKVTYHKEGELPEEPEHVKTMLEIDKPSTDEITTIYDRDTGALETVPDSLEETQEIEVNNLNEFGLGGQMGVIRPIMFPEFTTRQQAWRFAAWLKVMAETLPEEPHDHSFEEIEEAVKNGS